MVFSWFDAAVVHSEVSAEFEGCFHDVSSVAEVFEDGISGPEVVFLARGAFGELFKAEFVVFAVDDGDFLFLGEVDCFERGELNAAVFEWRAEPAGVVERSGLRAIFSGDGFVQVQAGDGHK